MQRETTHNYRIAEAVLLVLVAVLAAMLNPKYFNSSSHNQDAPKALLHFGRGEERYTAYTVDNDVENVAVFARTGEGKTSRIDKNFVIARIISKRFPEAMAVLLFCIARHQILLSTCPNHG